MIKTKTKRKKHIQYWLNKLTGLAIIGSLAASSHENGVPKEGMSDNGLPVKENVDPPSIPENERLYSPRKLAYKDKIHYKAKQTNREANDIMDLLENGGVIEHSSPLITFRIEGEKNKYRKTVIKYSDEFVRDLYEEEEERMVGNPYTESSVKQIAKIFAYLNNNRYLYLKEIPTFSLSIKRYQTWMGDPKRRNFENEERRIAIENLRKRLEIWEMLEKIGLRDYAAAIFNASDLIIPSNKEIENALTLLTDEWINQNCEFIGRGVYRNFYINPQANYSAKQNGGIEFLTSLKNALRKKWIHKNWNEEKYDVSKIDRADAIERRLTSLIYNKIRVIRPEHPDTIPNEILNAEEESARISIKDIGKEATIEEMQETRWGIAYALNKFNAKKMEIAKCLKEVGKEIENDQNMSAKDKLVMAIVIALKYHGTPKMIDQWITNLATRNEGIINEYNN